MAVQWWRIKAAYLKGDVTYRELAEKYKLSERTIRSRASKEAWGKERDKVRTEVSQAIHASAVRAREEQLMKLIEANDLMIEALLDMAGKVKEKPMLLFDEKCTLKNAESMAKAIQTAAQTQRDLHKLPTLDQDMRKKEEAQRKREAKAKTDLDREKWAMAKSEKENEAGLDGGVNWKIELPDELQAEGGELDG